MSCYLHHVRGRIRIKTPCIKGKPVIAQKLEIQISGLPGITLVSTNALTGSILVHYDETIVNPAAIIDLVSTEIGIDLSEAAHTNQCVYETLGKTGEVVGEKIGRAVLGLVIGRLLEGSSLAFLAAAI